jgi:hypothetical protein
MSVAAVKPVPTPTPTAAAAAPISRLGKTQKGRLKMPHRYLFYGENGVGKTTLAAHSPDPIWADIEDGSGRLDVARYSFRDEPGGHVPHTYAEFLAMVEDLRTADHSFRTLVVDSLDRLEGLIWQHMIRRDTTAKDPLKKIEDYGYGKGYNNAVEEWRGLCARFDRLRARGMSIILIGHNYIRTFKNPMGNDFDRYGMRVNEKAAPFIREWCDVVGFCAFEGGAKKSEDGRARGWETGKRFIHLERTAAYDAKSRLALPTEIELDPTDPWAPFAKAVTDAEDIGPPELRVSITAELARIGDDTLTVPVAQAVEKAKDDVEALSRIVNKLKSKEPKAAQ